MKDKISTNQYRSKIISFLLSVSSFQEAIQKLQEKLLNHIAFNPLHLYQYIIGKRSARVQDYRTTDINMFAKQSDFKNKLAQKLKIKNGYGIELYIRKYRRGRTPTKFAGQKVFSFKQYQFIIFRFLDTLMPYNPSVIRQSQFILTKNFNLNLEQYFPRQEKVAYQTYQKNFKRIVKIYKEMATLDIHHCLALQAMQNDNLLYFSIVKQIIIRDLKARSSIYDKNYLMAERQSQGNTLTLIKIRKWLQLYKRANQTDFSNQKDILNISRWCKGFSQIQIKRIFKRKSQVNSISRHKTKQKTIKTSLSRENRSYRSLKNNSLSAKGFMRKGSSKVNSTKLRSSQQQYQSSEKQGIVSANIKNEYYLQKSQQSNQQIFNNKLIKTQSLQHKKSSRKSNGVNFQYQYNSPKQIVSVTDKQTESLQQLISNWLVFCKMIIQNQKKCEFIKSTIKETDKIDTIIDKLYENEQKGYLTIKQVCQFVKKFIQLSNLQQDRWTQSFRHLKIFRSQLKYVILKQPINTFEQQQGKGLRYNYQNTNTFGFNIRNQELIHYSLERETNIQPFKKGISQVLANIIFQFFQARYQLCQLAKLLQQRSNQIFRFIDRKNTTYINPKTLEGFLLQKGGQMFINRDQTNGRETSSFRRNIELTKYVFQKQDIQVLFDYFGDGKIITQSSFARAITIQALGQFHNQ